jgi:hypothetical protein
VPREQAYRILAADGPGSLEAFLLPGQAGGTRAVLARENVRRGAAEVGQESRRLLEWVLTRTSIPADRIDAQLLGDLRTLGLTGPLWPDAIAVPAAELLSFVRWRWLVLGVLLALVMPPLIGWATLCARLVRRRPVNSWRAVLAPSAPSQQQLTKWVDTRTDLGRPSRR